MVAVLLVTHGDLAQALLSSAALIMGEAALIEVMVYITETVLII